TLTAASAGVGRGSTFRVELQAATAGSPVAARVDAVSPASSAAIRRVLLVEDHEDTASALKEVLQTLSCTVTTATSEAGALAAADQQSFDLFISDLGLPDGSGLDLMPRLRNRHGLEGIALTGYGMKEDVEKSREAGFADHIVKPVSLGTLSRAID